MTFTSQVRQGFHDAQKWASEHWSSVRRYLKLVAPCWFAALITFALSLGMLHPQAIDALAALAEGPGFFSQQQIAMLLTLVIFASSVWYITRALLYVRYEGLPGKFEEKDPRSQVLIWLPRVLGVLPIVAVALSFLSSTNFEFMVIYLLIAGAFVLILSRRRKWLDAKSGGAAVTELSPNLPKTTFRIVLGTLTIAFLLLILVIISPVMVPSAVGPLGVIYLAAAGWVIVGSAVLIYPSRRFQLPSLFVIMLVLSGVFGAWNDNHGITALPDSDRSVSERPALTGHFRNWLEHRRVKKQSGTPPYPVFDTPPYPVFVVTAEGGGIRAAYWTAAVLNAINSDAPEFPCHIFAMSGVSGGSLGAAAYAARLADVYYLSDADDRDEICTASDALRIEKKKKLDDQETHSTEITKTETVQSPRQAAAQLRVEVEALSQDFLSPVLAGMLFPDLVQRLTPVPFLPDRGSYLERSWEAAWPKAWHTEKAGRSGEPDNDLAVEFTDRGRTSKDDNRFHQDFLKLWDNGLAYLTPSLFLNATRVETGERVIVSNIEFSGEHGEEDTDTHDDSFDSAIDLLYRLGGSVKLSQAVHFSARFTYLSPAATIVDTTSGQSVRVVDGGYFENSGAVTAGELVDELSNLCKPSRYNCRVHVLIISNNVSNPNAWQQDRIGAETPADDGSCDCGKRDERGERDCDTDRSHGSAHDRKSAEPKTATFFSETLSPVRTLFATRSARGFLAEEQLFNKMPCRTYRAQLNEGVDGDRSIPLGWMLSQDLQERIECQANFSLRAKTFVTEIVNNYWQDEYTSPHVLSIYEDCEE